VYSTMSIYHITCLTHDSWDAWALSMKEATQMAVEHEADTGHQCDVTEEMDDDVAEWFREANNAIAKE